MGIYDRDYYRDEPRRSLMGNWSAVNFLIVVNVAIFVLDLFTDPVGRGERWLDAHMALRPDLLTHPWNFWTLLSYGFAHDPTNIIHVGGNMFVLWIFGVDVERLYGREKFMRVYLSLVVSSGLAWLIIQAFSKTPAPVIGASGAIMGIMVIYILNFPNRMFLLYFVVPVPAWVLGIVYVGLDIFGVVSPTRQHGPCRAYRRRVVWIALRSHRLVFGLAAADSLAEMGQDWRPEFARPHGRRRAANAARSANARRRDPGKNQPRRRSQPDARRTPRTRRPQPPIPQSAVMQTMVDRVPLASDNLPVWLGKTRETASDRRFPLAKDLSLTVLATGRLRLPVPHGRLSLRLRPPVRDLRVGRLAQIREQVGDLFQRQRIQQSLGHRRFLRAPASRRCRLSRSSSRCAFDCNTTNEPSGCGAANAPDRAAVFQHHRSCWRIDPKSPATGTGSIRESLSSGIAG